MNDYQCGGYSPPLEYPLTQAFLNSVEFESGCLLVDPCPGTDNPESAKPFYPSERKYVDTELLDMLEMVRSREFDNWPHELFSRLYPGRSYEFARETVHSLDNQNFAHGIDANRIPSDMPHLLQAIGVETLEDLAYLVSMDDPWDFPLHCLAWTVSNAGIKLRPEHAVPHASLKESKAVPAHQIMNKVLNLRRRIFTEKYTWGCNRGYNYPGQSERMVLGSDNSHRHPAYPSGHAGMSCATLDIDYFYDLPPEWRVYLTYCIVLFSWGRNLKGVHTQQDNVAAWKMGGLMDPYWYAGEGTREEYEDRNPNLWGPPVDY